jgi:hypothetical protein
VVADPRPERLPGRADAIGRLLAGRGLVPDGGLASGYRGQIHDQLADRGEPLDGECGHATRGLVLTAKTLHVEVDVCVGRPAAVRLRKGGRDLQRPVDASHRDRDRGSRCASPFARARVAVYRVGSHQVGCWISGVTGARLIALGIVPPGERRLRIARPESGSNV